MQNEGNISEQKVAELSASLLDLSQPLVGRSLYAATKLAMPCGEERISNKHVAVVVQRSRVEHKRS